MPKLSILIVARDATLLEASLVSVLQHRPADCEIVVVHDGEYQDPYGLAGEVRFAPAMTARKVDRLNRGIRLCQAPIVHVLRCGAEVTEGWTEAALVHFADPRVGAVAPLLLTPDGQRIAAAGLDYRASGVRVACQQAAPETVVGSEPTTILGPVLAAAFYRSSALSLLREPFCPAVGSALADVDLALRLARAGYCAMLEPTARVVDAAVKHRRSPLNDAWLAERLFWRHAAQSGGYRVTLQHAGVVATEIATTVLRPLQAGRIIGRAAGVMERFVFGAAASEAQATSPAASQPETALTQRTAGDLRVDAAVEGSGLPQRRRRQGAPKVA